MSTNYVNDRPMSCCMQDTEPARGRSETVLDKVKKNGICSTYMLYLIAVGVLFCSVMLGIVIWGNVVAKAGDPHIGIEGNTEHVLVSADGIPLATNDARVYAGLPGSYDDAYWHNVKVAGGTFPQGVTTKHDITGIEMVPNEKAVYLYTAKENHYFKFQEDKNGGATWEYYTPHSSNTQCSDENMTCHAVVKSSKRRRLEEEQSYEASEMGSRRLQGGFDGGINYDSSSSNLGLNGSLNHSFNDNWSGSLNGAYNHNFNHDVGNWNAGVGLNYDSGSGSTFGVNASTNSGGGYNVGVGFSFSW